MEIDINKIIQEYPFLNYINEDKSHYTHAKDAGYDDPDDLFLIGDSGGFLLNIQKDDKFVNTHLFTEMADFYRQNGCYTNYKEDSIIHRQIRKREEYRRQHGYSAKCFIRNGKLQDIRITGEHYNFLNYTLMEQLDEKSIIKGKNNTGKKYYDFSKFIDAQFYVWHIIEFARRNGLHLLIDKTRRGGFSYMMASKSSNTINLHPRKVVIHVADDKKYLTQTGGLTDFTINNITFYEMNTPFKRGILSTNKETFRLGFKLPNGVESPQSWKSSLLSVSAFNNPNCAIGKDAVEVDAEEVSTMENFDEFMNVTEPAMRTGAYTTGFLCAWGTATAGNMQTFEQNFYNPRSYNFMAFENVFDKDSRTEVCGFFKSYAWGLQGELDGIKAMDDDGNSNFEVAIKIAFDEREKKRLSAKTFAEYINYLGQYALYPAESFSSTTENIFTSEKLLEWEEKLKNDSSYKIYTDGWLIEKEGNVVFKTNARIKAEGGKFNKDYWDFIEGVPRKDHEHPHGCIRIWFQPVNIPYRDKSGNLIKGTPPGMYSISYDPVGVNKENKLITMKHSHNSIKVWMNPCRYNNFKTCLVATYYGRPEKLEEADRIALNLAIYYNCIGTVGVEVNRGETVSNFTKWKALKYLMKDPVEIWNNNIKAKVTASYGINMGGGSGDAGSGNSTKKLEGLRLLKEMLYSVVGKDEHGNDIYLFQTIYDYQSILELKKWNPMGNFDRVSEMIIRGLQWKQQDIEAAKELEMRKKVDTNTDNYSNNIMQREWY